MFQHIGCVQTVALIGNWKSILRYSPISYMSLKRISNVRLSEDFSKNMGKFNLMFLQAIVPVFINFNEFLQKQSNPCFNACMVKCKHL